MKISLTIDAMPILAGSGGISNYVAPLIENFLHISAPYFDTTLHFRTGSEDRRRRFRSLLSRSHSQLSSCQYRKTNLPDTLLHLCWKMGHLPFGMISLPQTDIYLATTEMMPLYRKVKKIAIVHDLTPAIIPQFFAEKRSHYLSRMTSYLKRCDAIIANSRVTADDITGLCGIGRDRITVIYPGISDPGHLSSSEASELGSLGVDRPFALYVGALAPNKNVEAVIQCFAHFIKATNCDWQLVLAGKNFMGEGYYEAVARREGVLGRTVFAGWVSEKKVRSALYANAKILLYLSWYEGFGLPLIEAMAFGLPALASNRGAIPEVISSAEQLVDPSNPFEAAERLSRFATDPDNQLKWKTHTILRSQEFNWKRSAEILLMTLRELDRNTCEKI